MTGKYTLSDLSGIRIVKLASFLGILIVSLASSLGGKLACDL